MPLRCSAPGCLRYPMFGPTPTKHESCAEHKTCMMIHCDERIGNSYIKNCCNFQCKNTVVTVAQSPVCSRCEKKELDELKYEGQISSAFKCLV